MGGGGGGEKWESFYSNLFKDYDSNQFANTLNTPVNQEKISKERNQFITKLTSGAELKKIVKSLKNGKSPGIDSLQRDDQAFFCNTRKLFCKTVQFNSDGRMCS